MLISPVIPYTVAKVFMTIKIYIAGTIGQLMLYLLVFRLTIYIYTEYTSIIFRSRKHNSIDVRKKFF